MAVEEGEDEEEKDLEGEGEGDDNENDERAKVVEQKMLIFQNLQKRGLTVRFLKIFRRRMKELCIWSPRTVIIPMSRVAMDIGSRTNKTEWRAHLFG